MKRAKKNPTRGALTFYVPSENPKYPKHRYMVVFVLRDGKWLAFCQCNDFFGRKLPHFGTNTFSTCKHIQKVKKEVVAS
jgi:hypothetical protein